MSAWCLDQKILAFFYWIHKKILHFIGFTKKSCILLDSQKNLAFYWLLLVFTQKSWARPISEFREFPKIKNRAPFFTLLQAANTTRPPAHEAKLLGAHFFGLLRGKKGAPRVYPWPASKATPLYVRPIIKDTLPY